MNSSIRNNISGDGESQASSSSNCPFSDEIPEPLQKHLEHMSPEMLQVRVYQCPDCHHLPSARRRPRSCPFCGGKKLKNIGRVRREMVRWQPGPPEYDACLASLPAALRYLKRGWSVIPVVYVKEGVKWKKRPPAGFKWTEFQERLPTRDEVIRWWRKWPQAGVAVICGPVSGVYVVDIDPRHGSRRSLRGKDFPPGPMSKTMHGGGHHFFSCDVPLPKCQETLPGVDFIGDGGYAVLPPSFGKYKWIEEPAEELPELPQWIADLVPAEDNYPPKAKGGKPKLPRLALPVTDVVRFLQELNRRCMELKLCWLGIMWSDLRTFSQLDGGSGFLVYDDAFDWLLQRGYEYYRIFRILKAGEGIFWDIRWGGRRVGIRLRSVKAVCRDLGVEIRAKAHWHTVPLGDFVGKREKLAYFRSVACYDSIDRRGDPKLRPISRKRIQERSGVSPATQLRDDKVLGLLNGKRRKRGGNACYKPNPCKEKEGDPDYLQKPSKHWSLARLGPKGRLPKVREALLRDGSRCDTGREADASKALHPRRYFDDDAEYEKVAGKCPVDPDSLVVLPEEERGNYRPVRKEVSLWREPLAVRQAPCV